MKDREGKGNDGGEERFLKSLRQDSVHEERFACKV